MSNNIFNERFYSHRQPAWHNLGVVSETPMGAQEAFSINPYSMSLQELSRKGSEKGIGHWGIFREPTPDNKNWDCFGIVSPKYVLLQPNDLCRIFDEEIGVHVETLGAINLGKQFFLTTKLPKMSIAGDPVDNYIVIVATWSGGTAMRVRATPVRVVCQNTLIASKSAATSEYAIRNVAGVEANLRKTMHVMYKEAKQKMDAMKELFGIWAQKKIEKQSLADILFRVYPNPEEPERALLDEMAMRQDSRMEYLLERAKRNREAVTELFDGAMTGWDDYPAVKGTAWGLYNSFTEWENYRTGRSATGKAYDVLNGQRANVMEMAFAVIQNKVSK